MIERRGLPRRSRVAERTVGRESNLRVVRTCRGLVSGQVAGNAGGHGQTVVIVDVAACASNSGMKTRQRESCCRMVKYRSRPGRGRVAKRTVCRERRRNMIWHHSPESRGTLPGSNVAAVTGR